jgi:hypothetical protein
MERGDRTPDLLVANQTTPTVNNDILTAGEGELGIGA